jgi:hypothetical protein
VPLGPFSRRGWAQRFPQLAEEFLLGGLLLLPDGLRRSTELHRGGVSDLSKPAQRGLTTIGTFNYFAGDDSTGPVFFAASWKK